MSLCISTFLQMNHKSITDTTKSPSPFRAWSIQRRKGLHRQLGKAGRRLRDIQPINASQALNYHPCALVNLRSLESFISLEGYISILLVSYSILSYALQSSYLPLSYPKITHTVTHKYHHTDIYPLLNFKQNIASIGHPIGSLPRFNRSL